MAELKNELEYEKPSLRRLRSSYSPSPDLNGHRRVLSRRRALQEFYNLQKDQANDKHPEKLEPNEKQEEGTTDLEVKFRDPETLAGFIKNSSIKDILLIRSKISEKLNARDMEKKSIIYDNYYELIKLGDTLTELSKGVPKTPNEGLGLRLNGEIRHELDVDKEKGYVESVLEDLAQFVEKESSEFNNDFEQMVELYTMANTESDSNASVKGINLEEKPSFPLNVDENNLVKEINALVECEGNSLSEETKTNYVNDIQRILKKLDSHSEELLILQLNELKKVFI